ncbi:hypothetical protein [Streptosporangium sp. CA-115845]|uniref:hypothetical protein n=1 Tax=Streptosporangium sp. CA-115845 TaxID=3240071 RepID=UPI003D8CD521
MSTTSGPIQEALPQQEAVSEIVIPSVQKESSPPTPTRQSRTTEAPVAQRESPPPTPTRQSRTTEETAPVTRSSPGTRNAAPTPQEEVPAEETTAARQPARTGTTSSAAPTPARTRPTEEPPANTTTRRTTEPTTAPKPTNPPEDTKPPSATPAPSGTSAPKPSETATSPAATPPATTAPASTPSPTRPTLPKPTLPTLPKPTLPKPTLPKPTSIPPKATPKPSASQPTTPTIPTTPPRTGAPSQTSHTPQPAPAQTGVYEPTLLSEGVRDNQPQAVDSSPRAVAPPPSFKRSSSEVCDPADIASCWSLAPWRSRTAESPDALPVSNQGSSSSNAPRWVFAPPPQSAQPLSSPMRTAAPSPTTVGCWSFSPSKLCARSWEE